MAKITDRIGPWQQHKETQALLKILALGDQEAEAGKIRPVAIVISELRVRQALENPK
jgi:hypothetical protein